MQENSSGKKITNPGWRALSLALVICIGGVIWHYAFQFYVINSGYLNDVFRLNFPRNVMPAYGRLKLQPHFFFLMFYGVSVTVLSYYLRNVLFSNRERQQWIYLLFLVANIAVFAATESGSRLTELCVHYRSFANDLHFFLSPSDLLQRFVSMQHLMDIHNQHYPPGNLFFMKVLNCFELLPYTKWIFIFLSIMVFYFSNNLLCKFKSPGFCNTDLVLICFAPGIIIFPSIDNSLWYAALSYVIIAGIAGFLETRSFSYALIAAAGLCVFSFFSFKFVLLIVVGVIYTGHHLYATSFRHAAVYIKGIAAMAVIFSAFYFLIFISTGYNVLRCMANSSALNMQVMQTDGWDNVWRYLLRSSGNFFGLFLGAGVVLLYALLLPKKAPDHVRSTFFSIIGVIIFGCCSGLFFMETERVFVCLAPLLAFGASHIVSTYTINHRYIIAAASFWFAILQEMFLQHYL